MEYLVNAPVVRAEAGAIYGRITLESRQLARSAKPGQFLHLKCEGLQLRRPISIAGVDRDEITLIYEIKGAGTRWLSRRKAGDTLDVLGPLGHGFPEIRSPLLLVGGGVGVPPMHFCAQRYPGSMAVLAFRSAERALLLPEMEALCVSLQVMTDDGSLGRQGFAVQGAEELLSKFSFGAVFACGPRIMLKTVSQAAEAAGVPCYVSLEERMGCGLGACLTCATPVLDARGGKTMKEVCKDGPVFRSEEVCWDG